MDEPFASLDAPTREGLQKFVLQMHAEGGLTMLIVTHSVEEAALIGRNILLLHHPPHQQAYIFPNPDAGEPSFIDTTTYHSLCALLRRELEAAI